MAINLNHTSDTISPDTGTANVSGDLAASGILKSNFSAGDEGGQIDLANAKTNTTLVTGVSIDVYQNRVRIFETGGTNRGYYFDMATAAAGVGSAVGASNVGSSTDTLSTITNRGNTTSNVILITNNLQATGANTGAFRVEGGISSNANIFASGNITSSNLVGGNILLPGFGNIISGNVLYISNGVKIGTTSAFANLGITVSNQGTQVALGGGGISVGAPNSKLGFNLFYDGPQAQWRYNANGYAASIEESNGSFIFKTASLNTSGHGLFVTPSETVRITDTGSVGVGSSSPAAKLHVVGNIYGTTGITTTGNIGLPAVGNITGTTTALTIPSGNVGIGTTNPLTRLVVSGTSTQAPVSLITSSQTGTTVRSNSVFRIQSEATGRDVYMQFSDNITNSTEIGMLSGNLYFCTGAVERARFDSAGNFGIGTTPVAPLDVKAGSDYRLLFTERGTASSVIDSVNLANTAYRQLLLNGNALIFATGATERARIDSSGNVGIGTSSPISTLNVVGSQLIVAAGSGTGSFGVQIKGTALTALPGSQTQAYIATGDSAIGTAGDLIIAPRTDVAAGIRFVTGTSPTERVRIDSSGNFGIGTSSPGEKVSINGNVGSDYDNYFYSYKGGTSGQVRAGVQFSGTSQYILFATATNERMRLDSNGYLGIATGSPIRQLTLNGEFSITPSGSTAYINVSDSAGSNGTTKTLNIRGLGTVGTAEVNLSSIYLTTSVLFCTGVYGTAVGATNRDVYVDNTGVIGYLSSVRASKTNIQDLTDTSWLHQLNPVSFNYRKKDTDGNYTEEVDSEIQYGMIAEEVEQIRPDLCFYDIVEDKQELRGVKYSKLVPVLLKAIQDQQKLIDSLTSRITALESKG